MKKKILKITSLIVMSTIAFFTHGMFLVGGMTSGQALAVSGNGMFFVGSSATMNVKTGTTISGNSATNGGGVYVASGGTLNMSGGTISENTATSGNGHNIYNSGTFTMTGGTIGTSGSSQTGYGIYNTGTMNLYGGTINDSIYSSTSFNTKIGATINGTITLSDSATINVVDYAGTTPTMKISVSSSRANGTILTFKGNVTAPDLTKLNVSGFDSSTKEVQVVQGTSSTEWNIVLAKRTFTVVFDENGGESSQSNIEMTLGEYYSGSVSIPTRLGYRFNGYYLLRGSSKIYYFNASGLSSKTCDFTDDEVSDGVVTLKADWSFIDKTFTRVNNKGIEDSNGDYVLYGMYPQTKVTKSSIISLLNTNADADGYSYLYNDAYLKYNGSWFKIEPIMWEIVETHETDYKSDNSTCYTLVATKILDLSIFNNSSGSSSSLYQYDNVFWWRDEYKSVLFDNVCDIVNKYGDWYFGSMYALMNYDNIGVYNYDDTYNMKTNSTSTNSSYQTIYSQPIRVPSYTDLSTYSGKITKQKTASDFAQAKGSDSTWWLASGYYGSVTESWFVDSSGYCNISSITESKGIVPMIRINDYYLMDCGHVCDIESLDDSEMIVEYDDDYHWHAFVGECIKNCGEQETFYRYDETEHTLSTTETISSYDNNYHYVTTTTTCSGCDFKKVTTTKVEHDTTTSSSYSYIDGGNTHTKSSTTKCKYCDYKTTSTTTMAHSGGTTVSTTYSDNGDGTHKITTTKKGCSICGTAGEYTTTSSVKHTTTTVSTTAYDDTNHWTETTTKCSYCSYQNVAKSNIVAHTLKETSYYEYNSTKHWLCTYQLCEGNCGYHTDPTTGTKTKHLLVNGSCACGYGTLAFTSSKHSHTCETCNNISIVQEVFFDEKKNKSQVLFIVDEKRYFSENYEAKNFQI